jgi:uncharacterized protein YaeQ
MPRLDLRQTLAQRVSPTERALALTLLAWINEVRAAAGLSPRTEGDLDQGVRHWLAHGPHGRSPEKET